MYSAPESENISRLLAEFISGRPYTQLLIHGETGLPEGWEDRFNSLEMRLLNGEPLQYVTGKCWFLGREFRVDSRVLIPRPETEELVDWVKKYFQAKPNPLILDVGTGSGCIATSLKLEIPGSQVWGMDISEPALELAKENAERLKAGVIFRKADALSDFPTHFPELTGKLDALVSNPPYIPVSEMADMHKNVLAFEPHSALFVPDEDALRFYRAIALSGKSLLKDGGRIFFEVHYNKVLEVAGMLGEMGYVGVEVKEDVFGRGRMVGGIIKN